MSNEAHIKRQEALYAHIDHLNATLAAQVNLTNALRDALYEALERAEDSEPIPASWIKDWRAILSKV